MESINVELKTVLRERYLRSQIQEVIDPTGVQISTEKMEGLLEKALDALENIDLSIDYLTSAITGHDPFAISIAQKVAGRGGVGTRPGPHASMEKEVDEALDPHRTLAAQEEDEYEEPTGEPGDIEADTVFPGGGPGEWQAAKDAELQHQRPPREYRRQAIKILASFHVDVNQQIIDILASELYNNALNEPTKAMTEPTAKPSLLKKFLRKVVSEELETYLAEKKKYEHSFYKAKEKKADELMASGTDEDAAYGIADTIVSKQGKKKKK